MPNRRLLPLVALFVPRIRSNLAVDRADACRDRGDWANACVQYRRALAICPQRTAIWVQLGHALKENGDPRAAGAAYRRATALSDADADAWLHLAMLSKALGEFAEAKAALWRAHDLDPDDRTISRELLEILHDPRAITGAEMTEAAKMAAHEQERVRQMGGTSGPAIVYEVSDLVSYFRHSRLPTGIQRVQIELIRGALDRAAHCQICCFDDVRDSAGLPVWVRIPAELFRTIADLAVTDSDPLGSEWIAAISRLTAIRAHGAQVEFARGGFLVNLGTSWWLANYFTHIRALRETLGVDYVPFIHDFIPLLAPEHCVASLVADFTAWVSQVFTHARFFLVNSNATRADLHRVARSLASQVLSDNVAVIPLGADFRRPGLVPAPPAFLDQHGLGERRYVLFVSTIESRKNHVMAFRAWQALIDRHGCDAVPVLVCVGNRGWLNDAVYAMLAADPELAGCVRMLSRLSDGELARLYLDCAITIYPSRLEGWGLPVTESLCYGKVPVVTETASLPEAGGRFARYVPVDDSAALAEAVWHLYSDPAALGAAEAEIRAGFRAPSWGALADLLAERIASFAAADPMPQPIGDQK